MRQRRERPDLGIDPCIGMCGFTLTEYLHGNGPTEDVVVGSNDICHSAAPHDVAQTISAREQVIVGVRTHHCSPPIRSLPSTL
ncbi:hypothetical protein RhoFasGS6_01105 [Rhodococcus fascians]|nr:hypothetical protein [Rhodococcus fascians]